MPVDFLVDADRVASLAATRQGRVSLGGFAYQAAYAVARLASLACAQPALELADVPTALRYDWAEDIDERLDGGGVVFTQCKRRSDAFQPANIAAAMLGLAPKLLWAAGDRDEVQFRLVAPDGRYRAPSTVARDRPAGERDSVRAALLALLREPPAPRADRALWYEAAHSFGLEPLADALWERLELVYVRDDVVTFDPAGPLFPSERAALDLLLRAQELHPARQSDALQALRAVLHGNVVAFVPNSDAPAALGAWAPRVIEGADVVAALLAHSLEYGGVAPFRVVDRTFLDAETRQGREPFVARFPEWRDVVHGDDAELRFLERDDTEELAADVRAMLADADENRDRVRAAVVVGAPGAGKSTLVRRVAAILTLQGACTVADPGAHLDPTDDREIEAIAAAIARLARAGRPVLLLLDDPFFADSSWPELLRRLRGVGPTVVLAATPSFLYDQYAHTLPNAVHVQTRELGPPSPRERRLLAELHGRVFEERPGQDDELIVVAMEAAAGQPFDQIIGGIWRTLNDGRPIDPSTPPGALPWLVRVFLLVCFFHRHYVVPRERLLRAALRQGDPTPVAEGEIAHALGRLVSSQGWHLFRVIPPQHVAVWAGPSVATIHPRVARAAWDLRPVPGFDVGGWLVPVIVTEPAAAFESGQLIATMQASQEPAATGLWKRLEDAWCDGIVSGASETRSLALFVSGGKSVDRDFPDVERPLQAAVEMRGPQAWIAALQLSSSRDGHGTDEAYPADLPLSALVDEADFSLAEKRAVMFAASLTGAAGERLRARFWEIVSRREPVGVGLPAWMVAREPAEQLDAHVDSLLAYAQDPRLAPQLLPALLKRGEELRPESIAAIAAAAGEYLASAHGDLSAIALAGAVRSTVGRANAYEKGRARSAIETLSSAFTAWEVATPSALPELRSKQLVELRSAEEIVGDTLARLPDTSPAEVAAWLAASDAANASRRRVICDMLREASRTQHDPQLAAVAFYLLWPHYGENEGTACTLADLAFMSALDDAAQAASELLTAFADGRHPSVVGRLAALAALSGDGATAVGLLRALRTRDRSFALVGLWRMLGPNASAEAAAWRALWVAARAARDVPLSRLLLVCTSGRVLAVKRALGPAAPATNALVGDLLPGVAPNDLIPTLQGLLFAWARNPDDVIPNVFAYQAVSMYEVLVSQHRANPLLEERLAAMLQSTLALNPDVIDAFAGWAEFSPVAARALRQLDAAG